MSEKRVIKKYPNRRLYDTAESKYITLEDVRKLVLDEVQFCVIDKKSGEDITRNILLQIILEQEDFGDPIFTTDVLQQIISFYGNSVQKLATDFFERSMSVLKQQQQVMHSQLGTPFPGNPIDTLTDLTQRNIDMWRKLQEDFFRAAVPGTPASKLEDDEGGARG